MITTSYRLEIYRRCINIYVKKRSYQYIFSEWGTTTRTVDWYLMAYPVGINEYIPNLKEQIYDYTV